jgi:hypothetical protein
MGPCDSSKWKVGKEMTTEMSFVDSALRAWKSNVERADKLFGGLSPELLAQEVAPGKNRLFIFGDTSPP